MKIIKVSDYLVSRLKKCGIETYFGVQGGAIAHVIESSAKISNFIPVFNEQAGGLAAHGYYFSKKKPAAVLTTTGPGFLNGVTGMGACYYDNIPSVFITGQVSKELNLAKKFNIKMYGFQEVQHIDIGKNISDHHFVINSDYSLVHFIRYLESINYNIKNTIFIEIQDAFSRSFVKYRKSNKILKNKIQLIPKEKIKKIRELINNSLNPLLLIGAGFSDFNSRILIKKISKRLNIPVCYSWGGSPHMDENSDLNLGYFGMHNPGIANKFIQSSDLLISVGISFLQHQVGKERNRFSPHAQFIYVNKNNYSQKRVNYDFQNKIINIKCDSSNFLENLLKIKIKPKKLDLKKIKNYNFKQYSKPVKIIAEILSQFRDKNKRKEKFIFSDAGSTLSWTYQAANIVKKSNVITSFNIHTMGYSIPAGIGAALNKDKDILSIIGDGGLLMNVQELVNFCRVSKNLKIVIIDNKGYGIIRQTQDDFFQSNYIGTKIGLKNNMPKFNVKNIVESFNLKVKVENENISQKAIKNFFNSSVNCLVININTKYKVENLKPNNKNDYLVF